MKGPYLNALQDLLRPEVTRRRVDVLTDATSGQTVVLRCHASDLDVLIVKLDDIPAGDMSQQDRLFPLLDPAKPDATRCCDFMLFCQRQPTCGGDLFVLLAELKQGGRGALPQLRNGCLLARWLLSVMALHRPSVPAPARVFFRGVVFSDRVDLPRLTTGRGRLRYPELEARPSNLRVAVLPGRPGVGYDLDYLLNDCGDAPWLPGP